jgi:hypothetical protein
VEAAKLFLRGGAIYTVTNNPPAPPPSTATQSEPVTGRLGPSSAARRARARRLGSALARIGLTIPAVAVASVWLGLPLALGLDPMEAALLMLTFLVSTITLGTGRTYLMQGAVYLVIFAAFLFLTFVP